MNSKTIINKPIKNILGDWLNSEPEKKDIIYVLCFYVAGVIIHYIIGNFPKALETYGDEYLYFTIAQSIYNGTGILCANAPTSFTKVLYSLVISPFFACSNVVLRIHLINLFNSMLIMSSLILVYFIAKELKFKRGGIISVLLIALVWPDMMYSISLMSENLNWPFTMLFIYLWLRSKKSKYTIGYSALLGCMCYIGYLIKDIFLAIFLSYILFELCYPFLMFLMNRKENKCKLKDCYSKRDIAGIVVFVLFFVVCYFIGNALLHSVVSDKLFVASSKLADPYTLMYLFYSFFYYLAAVLIATLIIPVVYSILNFNNIDKNTQKLFSFLIIYLLVSCAMIAYTISINEDLGRIVPRVHFRYIGYILLLLIVVFLKLLQEKPKSSVKHGIIFFVSLAVLLFSGFICKGGLDGSVVDRNMFNIYEKISYMFPSIRNSNAGLTMYPYAVIIFALLFLIVIVFYLIYSRGMNKSASAIFVLVMVSVNIGNSCLEYKQYQLGYSVEEERINSIIAINEWLDDKENKKILYLADEIFAKSQKTVITYFKDNKNLYTTTSDMVQNSSDNGFISVPETQFFEPLYHAEYGPIEKFDYILVDENCKSKLKNVSVVEEVSNKFYTLYKNEDPQTVIIYPSYGFNGEPLDICFTNENYNASAYIVSGISYPEEGFSWTDGDSAKIKIPVYGDFDSLDVEIEVVGTFAGSQAYQVVQNKETIAEGSIDGAGKITFNAKVYDNMLEFDVLCPGSLVVSQVTDSTDNRKVAFRFSKMTVKTSDYSNASVNEYENIA